MHGGWLGSGSLPQLPCGRRDVGSPGAEKVRAATESAESKRKDTRRSLWAHCRVDLLSNAAMPAADLKIMNQPGEGCRRHELQSMCSPSIWATPELEIRSRLELRDQITTKFQCVACRGRVCARSLQAREMVFALPRALPLRHSALGVEVDISKTYSHPPSAPRFDIDSKLSEVH
eukprot:scaffold112426_cov63-Phaeocystis_antarctica.AAC.3